MCAQRTRTHRLGRSGKRGTEVFEQERNPSKGTCVPGAQPPGGIQCRRLLARQVEEVGNDGVQMAGAFQSPDRRFEEFRRRHLARGDQFGLSDRVEAYQFKRQT